MNDLRKILYNMGKRAKPGEKPTRCERAKLKEKTISIERAKPGEKPMPPERAITKEKPIPPERVKIQIKIKGAKMQTVSSKKEKQATVRLGDVVINPEYQVRMKVDSHMVSNYAMSMREGHIFPPIVLERGTGKLVCGFTRIEAYYKVYSPNDRVPGERMFFKDDIERLRFAAKDNTTHGQPLSGFDKKNIITKLRMAGAALEVIGETLGMPIKKIKTIAGQGVVIIGRPLPKGNGKVKRRSRRTGVGKKLEGRPADVGNRVFVNGELKLDPVKAGLTHLHGKEMSVSAYENMRDHYLPNTDKFLMENLIMRFDDGTLNLESEEVVKTMGILCGKLCGIVKK